MKAKKVTVLTWDKYKPRKTKKQLVSNGTTYKVWVTIEELKPDGDPSNDDIGILSDSIGHFNTLAEAVDRVSRVVHAFGTAKTIETSDSCAGLHHNVCKHCGCQLDSNGLCPNPVRSCFYHKFGQDIPYPKTLP